DLYLFTCEPITLDAGKGTGSENYEWEDGSQRRYRKVEENGTYWVTVRNDGCMVTDTIIINLCELKFYIPDAFSPNEDGINDIFKIITTDETALYTIQVFSRSGLAVTQIIDAKTGWNGKDANNEYCLPGIYVWHLQITEKAEKSIKKNLFKTGHVALIR
ncbi:MAG: gliding motility-associated C-terminal domain-containing protein, partial [Bacteroidales bacterium]|nr:gliding motility-associated C-terminal domain-containing protein [Bacteroidales bacterium]